jgi:general secretion pathway protein L
MTPRQMAQGFGEAMDAVAEAAVALLAWRGRRRKVRLVETGDGVFALHAAGRAATVGEIRVEDGRVAAPPAEAAALIRRSRAEIVLKPSRFLFRPLELPRRATEFLAGIIRAQIDRLTPWAPAEAAFGWTAPVAVAPDRIAVTVVATARSQVAPLITALAGLGAEAIVVTTRPPEADAAAAPVTVLEERLGRRLDPRRLRRGLALLLGLAALAAAAGVAADVVIGGDLSAQQEILARRIAERRAALRLGRDAGPASPLALIERRKHETPSSVIVIEELSRVLPDHTYVIGLRIEGDRLQITGITRDAPALIRLIEQSPSFTRATFFAPTTRAPADPGERVHIEARIKPIFSPGT